MAAVFNVQGMEVITLRELIELSAGGVRNIVPLHTNGQNSGLLLRREARAGSELSRRIARPRIMHPPPDETARGMRSSSVDPWVERLAWLMDGAIRIGPWSIGLDGLLGLVPGIGDAAGAIISMLIVLQAVRSGIPRVAVARMLTNIAFDTLVGTIPVFGDIFDFAYKANLKNLRIYEESLSGRPGANVRHWLFFVALALALLAIVAVPVILVVLVLRSVH